MVVLLRVLCASDARTEKQRLGGGCQRGISVRREPVPDALGVSELRYVLVRAL